MMGFEAATGRTLSGIDHLRQSIRDILTTPLGTRVMRRDYGSRLYELVDAPVNQATLLDLYAATAEALATWEPRIALQRVQVTTAEPGSVVLSLTGQYLPDGRSVTFDGLEIT